ncbi:MAG TPA: prolipoprotein diacylglyceryl transferase family protein [Candidatus Limnocylindrales bacterium]|nr:prolipoprotein diacylglyceryl transferase family protein [Candidatus Limnocylindrales bacterium]
MGPAVITFAFDPVLKLGDAASVRIETLALAAVLFVGIAMAARIGRLTPAVGPYVPAPTLRPDDLIFIVVGAVPGAIIGGRLGYVLGHLDFYTANPSLMLDPTTGGFELTLAVPLAVVTGAVIARLVGAPVARWMHAVSFPLLFVLAAAKLVGVLGANGQGLPIDLPWATAYAGPGPWDSLGPAVPSHPSQLYEAGAVLVAIVLLAIASRWEVIRRRDGAALFAALGLWAIARFAIAFTWRDPIAAGPLRVEQVLLLGLVAVCAVGLVERRRAPIPTLEEPEPLEVDELEA